MLTDLKNLLRFINKIVLLQIDMSRFKLNETILIILNRMMV